MSGSNRRRTAHPSPSILPPPGAGLAHYEREILSRSPATGRRVRSRYIATGEYPDDLDLTAPGALSARNLVRVAALVHDSDLVDWLIGAKIGAAEIADARRLVDGTLFDPRTGRPVPAGHKRASGQPWLSDALAVKVLAWQIGEARLSELLSEHRRDLVAELADYYGQPPTVLTRSGYGFHALYWLPADAGRMDDDSARGGAAARRVNADAVRSINARAGYNLLDPACIDAGTRILREIGTTNDKSGSPIEVTALDYEPALRLDIGPLADALAPAQARIEAAPAPRPAAPAAAPLGLPRGYTGAVRSLDIVALFRARGLYIGPAGRGHYVRCPWAGDHSTDDARAWVVAGDHRWPRYQCKHASCAGRDLLAIMHLFGADACMAHTWDEHKRRPPAPPADAPPAPPADAPRTFERGDAVELSAALVSDELSERAVYDRGRFWVYAPARGAWVAVSDAEVRRRLRRYAGAPVHAGRDKSGRMKTRPLRLSQAALEGARAATADLLDRPGFFADAPPACGFIGGALRPTGEIVPPSPDNRLIDSWCLPFALDPMTAPEQVAQRAPTWSRFLSSTFRDDADAEGKARLIMEFIGVALLGWSTRMERALVCQSDHGGSGKSTLAKAVASIFPASAVCSVPLHRLAGRFGAAPIAEARLNLVSDLPSSDIVDAGDLKAIITGDLVSFERKHRDAYSAAPTAAHLILANDLPAVRDRSDGFWSRFLVLKFNRRFRNTPAQDRAMPDKLRSEREHIAAACLYHGLAAIKRGDYTVPSSTRAATAAWERAQNTVAQWLAEATRPPSAAVRSTPGAVLFSAYKSWAIEAGYRPLGRNKYYQELGRASVERLTVGGATHFARVLVVPHLRAV